MNPRLCKLVYPAVSLCLASQVSCDDGTGNPAKDYGEFRLKNESAAPMTLWVGGELRATAAPNQLQVVRAPEGLVEVAVRTAAGAVRFRQMADVPDNAFAQYNVKPDGSVILSAGNIAVPEVVGSRKEQVKLQNNAAYPVELVANGEILGVVPAYLYATFNVPKQVLTLVFRRPGGKTLFTQTVDIPRNGYFAYTVLPDGRVIATGGEVNPNTQMQWDPYYYGR